MFNLQPIAFDFIDEKLSESSFVLITLWSDCKAAEWHRNGKGMLSCVSNIEQEPPDEFSIAVRAW